VVSAHVETKEERKRGRPGAGVGGEDRQTDREIRERMKMEMDAC
jgi:hypothetical protein